jgi:glutathione S-transferase
MTSSPHVVLLGVPKKPNCASSSGFCQKLEVFLRYSKISYELRDTYPYKAPKGKVPYAEITHDGKTITISDSHFIIQYLVEKGLIKDPDELAGLTVVQRAESRAFQAYVEELLYLAIVYDRWYVDENYAVTTQETFGDSPWPVRSFLSWFFRRRVTGVLYSAGIGRHSPEEVHRLQKEALEALEAKYAEHKYFHGGELPSRIDLTVYGFLANILSTGGSPYFTNLVLKSMVLRSLVGEMTRSLFPEYEDLLGKVQVNVQPLDSE